MITVTGTFTVKQDKVAEIVSAARSVQNDSLTKDEGCLEYKFHQLSTNEASFFVYEIWESKQSLDHHAESDHFKRFATLLEDNLEVALDIRIYNGVK